jgi:hypothetical protein
MKYIKNIEYKGHRIKIAQDIDPMSPAECDDELVCMVSFDRNFSLHSDNVPVTTIDDLRALISGPSEDDFDSPLLECDKCRRTFDPDEDWNGVDLKSGSVCPELDCDGELSDEDAPDDFKDAMDEWEKDRAEWAIFQVTNMAYNGASLRFNGEPDVDTIKVAIFVKKDGGWGKDVDFEKVAKGYCETWEQYLSGEVYGYMIDGPLEQHQDLCEKCGHVQREYEEREELDSCWGFYGLDYCIQEAKDQVDYYVKEKGEKK